MERCPACNSRSMGKVGTDQYYCSDCCAEIWLNSDGSLQMYEVQDDGTLLAKEVIL